MIDPAAERHLFATLCALGLIVIGLFAVIVVGMVKDIVDQLKGSDW